jgi:hypothetical protein
MVDSLLPNIDLSGSIKGGGGGVLEELSEY